MGHVMAMINAYVVHATAEAEKFDFEYQERTLPAGKDASILSLYGFLPAISPLLLSPIIIPLFF